VVVVGSKRDVDGWEGGVGAAWGIERGDTKYKFSVFQNETLVNH
jgi:hypothetical protein